MAYCLAIASGKGGVGKSALAANLGAALSECGKRVILIDADIGLRSLDALLSLENNVVYDLIDLAGGNCEAEDAILVSEAFPNLSLLPAAQFKRARSLEPKQFRRIISSLRERFDYILIDCPAGIERGLRNVLNAQNMAGVCGCQALAPSLTHVSTFLQLFLKRGVGNTCRAGREQGDH